MKHLLKKTGLSVLGLLQGTLGSYLALLGLAFAFPESEPGCKDYEEDLYFVPLGFALMLLWLAVMIAAFLFLRKNKANFLSFFIPWLIGVGTCLVVVFYIL